MAQVSGGLDLTIDALRDVLEGRLSDIGRRFSAFVGEAVPHSALVIFTRECTGRPRKVAGDPAIVDRVTITELDALRHRLGTCAVHRGRARIAGADREIHAILDRTDTLLVLVRSGGQPTMPLDTLRSLFGVVATAIALQVGNASPAYLAESRAASAERARTIAELSDTHAATLETVLATLRSNDLSDGQARAAARETATTALVELRSSVDVHRELSEEAVTTAFARMRGELAGLIRHRSFELEFAPAPPGGRRLPGEIAHAARAVARGVVLAMAEQTEVRRVRVAWAVDDDSLTVDLRDDADGTLDAADLERQLRPRVETLRGAIAHESTPGWGSRISAVLPLAEPAGRTDPDSLAELAPREVEVLAHLVAGRRNRDIGQRLGVSESTVKFHVAGVLRKLDVRTRGEAAAVGSEAGITPAP
ncbi:helix-turn-helix transcriptional regulator [Rhodococcus rhodnii]|uniref:LuxR family transcriptional regulator n=1 Tax=Rhodococcus rhodnii LMG 5362 TaxID=1273125 RepID=R7WJ39_9NOCA|nr:helix-turn-helix transcriptional regulator [Rhodococcus rhodnii]EOM75266.1 LuxR family transcriptional regulator [Rhodococcus rhodnii LMG 5362]